MSSQGNLGTCNKILFTIQWYPSVLSANALCDEKIINELKQDGNNDITCLTYKGGNQKEYEILNGVRIFRYRRSIWWDKVIDAKRTSGCNSKFVLWLDRIWLRIKEVITVPLYPYVDLLPSIKFVRRAIALHKKERFDIVVSEHHGLDSLLAGYFLKRLYPQIKFVAILWDPICAKEPARYLPASFAKRWNISFEKKILKAADALIGQKSSENTVKSLIEINPLKHFFFDIPNIVRPIINTPLRDGLLKEGMINIVFSGILSLPDRDPEYIVQALGNTIKAKLLNLIFLCSGAGKEKLRELQKTFHGNIVIHEYIPHEEIMTLYSQCDVLLNFGGRNPNMVPSKIFEYMSFGKPIISMYSIDNEASKTYFDKYPLALCLDEREPMEQASQKLNKFISDTVGTECAFEDVEKLYPLNTPHKYVDLIKSL